MSGPDDSENNSAGSMGEPDPGDQPAGDPGGSDAEGSDAGDGPTVSDTKTESSPKKESKTKKMLMPSPAWSGATKRFMAAILIIAAVWIFYVARNVITMAALAGLIAFLLAPVIRLMHRKLHVPRALALFVSYIVVFVILTGIGFLMVDGVAGAVGEISVPEAQTSLRTTAEDWLKNVREIKAFGYTVDFSETVDPWLEKLEEDQAKDSKDSSDSSGSSGSSSSDDEKRLSLSSSQVETLFGGLTSSFATVGSALVAALMSGLVIVLVAMYLNADSGKFHNGLVKAVPEGYQDDAAEISGRVVGIWRGYIYGQLLNSLITGLMVWFVLWLVGLPGAFVFGLLMALLNMIPTFGPILAAIPGILAAIALGSTRLDTGRLTFTIIVAVIYLLVVQLQANVIAPYITGKAVKLSPATVLIGLVVGVQVAGIVGALLVVPVVATGKEIGRYVLAKLSDRPPFEGEPILVDTSSAETAPDTT